MKTFASMVALLLLAAFCFVGCSNTKSETTDANNDEATFQKLLDEARMSKAEIRVCYVYIVPDSLKDKVAKLMVDMMAGGSRNLTTSDYEDPEDLAEVIAKYSNDLYSVREKRVYLEFVPKGESDYHKESLLYEDLRPAQKKVFDYLNT